MEGEKDPPLKPSVPSKMIEPSADLIVFRKYGHYVLVSSEPRKLLPTIPPPSVIIGKPIGEYEFLDEVLALAPSSCHCYLLSDDSLHAETLCARGFDTFALIWDQKGLGSMSRLSGLRIDSAVLLFGVRGGKGLRKDASDILRFQPAIDNPAPPEAFWHEIFTRSTLPGDEIFNPFGRLGMAPFRAATNRKVKLTAFETWQVGEELVKG